MPLLFKFKKKVPKKSTYSYKFNKEEVIQSIKQQLHNPWVWYTLGDCMEEVDNPKYDLLIMRNKEVDEKVNINRPFSMNEFIKKRVYSIVLGIYVVETRSWDRMFDTTNEFVTAAVQVNSASFLIDNIIGVVDNNEGVIANVC